MVLTSPKRTFVIVDLAAVEFLASIGIATLIRCARGAGAQVITPGLEKQGDAVRMTIMDDGAPFDPVSYPVPDPPRTFDEARPGGLGLYFMRATADLVHRRLAGWNALTLTLTSPPPSVA